MAPVLAPSLPGAVAMGPAGAGGRCQPAGMRDSRWHRCSGVRRRGPGNELINNPQLPRLNLQPF